MESTNEHIDELVARCLSGEATAAESQELETWRMASEEHEKYYQDIAFLYHATAQVPEMVDVDTERAWAKVFSHIEEPKVLPLAQPVQRKNIRYIAIAASIIFLLGLVAVLYRLTSKEVQPLSLSTQDKPVEQLLPDGSKVNVMPHSQLATVQQSYDHARAYKLKGEASFSVVHDEKKPFLVYAGKAIIKDLGTVFDIKAYENRDTIAVDVASGSVQLYAEGEAGIRLVAKERGIYIKSSSHFLKLSHIPEKVQTQELAFNNTPLTEVVDRLNSTYGMKLIIGSEKIRHCRITVKFNNANQEEIIYVLTQTLSLKAVANGNTVTLYGKVCE